MLSGGADCSYHDMPANLLVRSLEGLRADKTVFDAQS